jgi:gamma-glutamyl hercynylcysteine S-oxide synthase
MVRLDGGTFLMGSEDELAYPDDGEGPVRRVAIRPFWIDAHAVSNDRFGAFAAATGHVTEAERYGWSFVFAGLLPDDFPPTRAVAAATWWRQVEGADWAHPEGPQSSVADRGNHPVVHVSWDDAATFAAWEGKRLPTEAEWEKAARFDPATGRSRRFPWGDDEPTPALANLGQRHLQPAPVGAYPAGVSPLGVHQMVGDVWEWTTSGWHPYPGFSVFPYPEYSQVFFGGDYRVLRGGSFGTDAAAIRSTFRNWDHPIRRQIFSCFRCARSVEPGSGPEGA